MQHYYDIAITVDGQPCSGRWTLKQGGRLHVSSAWGVDTVDCEPCLRPEAIACQTLERIVRAYRRARAEEQRQEARALARVTRYWDRKQKKPEGDHA